MYEVCLASLKKIGQVLVQVHGHLLHVQAHPQLGLGGLKEAHILTTGPL